MVRKFTTNCNVGGGKVPVTLYIGNPASGNHPLNFQNRWLSEMPWELRFHKHHGNLSKLSEIAEKHKVSLKICATM